MLNYLDLPTPLSPIIRIFSVVRILSPMMWNAWYSDEYTGV